MTGLRFCFLTTFYPPHNFGGDGIGVQRLARGLVKAGHRVTVVHDVDAYNLLHKGAEPAEVQEPAGSRSGAAAKWSRDRCRRCSPSSWDGRWSMDRASAGSWTRASSTSSTSTTSRWSAGRDCWRTGRASSCTWLMSTGWSAPLTYYGATAARSAPAASACGVSSTIGGRPSCGAAPASWSASCGMWTPSSP